MLSSAVLRAASSYTTTAACAASSTALNSRSFAEQHLSFFHVDLPKVRQQFQRWKRALPQIRPHYAVKCNPDPIVLLTLYEQGAGFDCASVNEIQNVIRSCKHPRANSRMIDIRSDLDIRSDIIFANPMKAEYQLLTSAQLGVQKVTADSVQELRKIACLQPNAEVFLRILVDDKGSLCRLGVKFGANMDDVPELFREAQKLDLNMTGVSFHAGSGQQNAEAYACAISDARAAFDIAADFGHEHSMRVLNIGGGFVDDDNFEYVADVIKSSINLHFHDDKMNFMAEPGRFMVSASHRLFTKVIGRKHNMLFVNDSIYGSFNSIMFDHQEHQPEAYMRSDGSDIRLCGGRTGMKKDEPKAVSIWGQTCDGLDRITQVSQVGSADVGDWLIWPSMGAYSAAAGSTFNGFETPEIFYLDDEVVAVPGEGERMAPIRQEAAGM